VSETNTSQGFNVMNINTRKYLRILDAQSKIYGAIKKLPCSGSNWRTNRDKVDKLELKNNEYRAKLELLCKLITEDEFNEHLSDRMCCTWEDFKN